MDRWPALSFQQTQPTLNTLHMWAQIVGKIRLCLSPWQNHAWNSTLYLSPRGFTTGAIPIDDGLLDLEFDFLNHQLLVRFSQGNHHTISLQNHTVASFYQELTAIMDQHEIILQMYSKPNEVDPAIAFAENHQSDYEPDVAQAMWQVLMAVHNVFFQFRAGFNGKSSPVHLFWGAFDLAVTRFSGREAPPHPGGMPNIPLAIMREAYSHEVSSAGFWFGHEGFEQAAFYAYSYPTPEAYSKQKVSPDEAHYHDELGEYVLHYETVRRSDDPAQTLMSFLQSTYEAAAITADWDRSQECNLSYLKYAG